ncbi:uncharacterized protein A4U43_C03F21640 [Asparagus officinalis]|uniref:Nudix hydrolase domain-containing protein n=1 Tax=Asparagus officinalis TaxID=4686 RepID=A0A5P1FG88_ASPOF|nr:uncharacterized protein A4U43_C03F21640 [Asparagus officinalis]
MPQGGVDEGEDPRGAAIRELREETGVTSVEILDENLGPTEPPLLVTLNPPCTPRHTKLKWRTRHPVPSVAASKASLELEKNSGQKMSC